MAKREGTKVWTGTARMSYANVFVPRKAQGSDKEEYSVAILIPKSDTETVKHIEAAIEEAKEQGKSKWGGKIPNNLDINFRDGDDKDDEVYHDHWYINAKSQRKPGVVKRVGGRTIEIDDEDEFYSGVYAIATINFFAYNSNGKKGISAGLGNLLKVRDGERLAGGASAESDFEDFGDTEDDIEDDLLD